jgi:DNA primase
MADSSEIFSRVRAAVDIVEIIGEHVALKRAGREFKGLCPFHEDHRPSMAVVPHKQIFHCFVCGTGGDVFKFVKEFHKMGNGEALRMLAQRAGIKLPELPRRSGAGPEKDKDGLTPRERIAATNEWACDWFEKQLRTSQGKAGLDYLHSRGLTDETIAKFRLGFAPEGWTAMVNAAMRAGLSNDRLLEAGLIKQRQDSSPYDAFRNRVIFPIIDATGGSGSGGGGRVIAFGGRVLVEKRDEAGNVVEAKYLNSPETKLFVKSESLYGLNLARQQIIRTRTAIVVEGYMDVIACHQAGVANVIATLGTALTPEHARILKNYAQTSALVFDSDDAGRRAADRAMEVFVRSSIDVKIAAVPQGKDPCDYCMANGGEEFQKIVDNAVDALTFQWNRAQSEVHGADSVAVRQQVITRFMRFAGQAMGSRADIHRIDPIRRGQLIYKLAGISGLPVDEVTSLLYKASYGQPQRPAEPIATEPNELLREREAAQSAIGKHARVDAQRWILGSLLNAPREYLKFSSKLFLRLFSSFFLSAEVILDYLEQNRSRLDECGIADFTNYVSLLGKSEDESKLIIYCSIRFEQMIGGWLEPNHISEETAKLIQYWRAQLGHTFEVVIRDCLDFLIETTDPEKLLPLGTAESKGPSEEDHMADILRIAKRNAIAKTEARTGNPRVVGVEPANASRPEHQPTSADRMLRLEQVAELADA